MLQTGEGRLPGARFKRRIMLMSSDTERLNAHKYFKALQKDIHNNAKAKGFYNDTRSIPELLCLIHSEVSEALEAYRKDDDKNLREELADIAIRVMDASEYLNIDLFLEIVCKHAVNKERSYKHGKKC